MGQGLGHIQKKILTVLKTLDEKYIEEKNRELRWIWLNILIIKVYRPEQMAGEKNSWNWSYEKKEHRRIWESVRMLEKRGLVECRVINAKEIGLEITKFGGCQRWMEVRVV